MIARQFATVCLLIVLAGCAGPTSPSATTGYAHLLDSPVRGLTPGEIQELKTGAGMRLALPAELNGYPGPKHVLDLANDLGLNASQRQAVQSLYDRTNQQARAAGEKVLESYRALDGWFRNGTGSADDLEQLVKTLGEREAQLRLVHLRAHVECRDLLTDHQVELYKDLRGYGGQHTDHAH